MNKTSIIALLSIIQVDELKELLNGNVPSELNIDDNIGMLQSCSHTLFFIKKPALQVSHEPTKVHDKQF